MPGPMLTITDLLRDAADALEEAYKGRDDVRQRRSHRSTLRELVEHITAGKHTSISDNRFGPPSQ
jgi:Spy/CpxP family protein refolding chaperone